MTRQTVALALYCAFVFAAIPVPAQKAPPSRKPPDESSLVFDVRRRAPGADASSAKDAEVAAKQAATTARIAAEYPRAKALFHPRGELKFLAAPPAERLSEPQAGDPAEVALGFLRANAGLFSIAPSDVDALRETHRTAVAGLTQLTFQQILGDSPVWGGSARVAVDGQGRVVQAEVGRLIAGGAVAGERLFNAREAAAAAWEAAGGAAPADDLAALEPSSSGRLRFEHPDGGAPLIVEPVVFPRTPQQGVPAYRAFVTSSAGSFEILVSAVDGELLYRAGRTVELGSARVFRENPNGPRELVQFPDGWLPDGGEVTMGNNADTFLDVDSDGEPDPISSDGLRDGRAAAADQIFDFPFSDAEPPGLATAAAGVTNAFYFANVIHDFLYELGFTETDGNFQVDNFGRGGDGGDPFRISVQSDDALFNAFARTLPDGESGRIDLGVFFLDFGETRDTAVDGDVVIHEYVHGVSNRLVGGPDVVDCLFREQPGAVGEAISDYFPISLYDDPVVGEYVTGDTERGARRASYAANPRTLADLGDPAFEVHDDGEILAAALWDLRERLGASVTDQLVVDALKLSSCAPTFLDFRDALLTADNGANEDVIWEVFAARGMGSSARIRTSDDSPNYTVLFDAGFDAPGGGGNRAPRIVSEPDEPGFFGERWSYRVRATDLDGDDLTMELIDAPDGATFDPASGVINWTANFTGGRFQVAVTDSAGARTVHGVFVRSIALMDLGRALTIEGLQDSFGQGIVIVPDGARALQFRLRGGSGDPDFSVLSFNDGTFIFSNRIGPNETITVERPSPGPWSILVEGADDYSGVRLVAETPRINQLAPGNIQRELRDAFTSERIYRINVPADASLLRVTSLNGEGDVDLYVAREEIPTCQGLIGQVCNDMGFSAVDGNVEQIVVENPATGEWFLSVVGFDQYSGVTLRADFTPPEVRVNAGTNAGSFEETLAPLGLGTVFGENLAREQASATTLPLPIELGGLRLLINGAPAPLVFANGTQANFQTPGELLIDAAFGLDAEIVAVTADDASFAHVTGLAADAPGLFTFFLGDGSVAPVIVHADGSVVTPENPARPGETLIAFLTGVGLLDNPPETGAGSSADPLATALASVAATVGGAAGEVAFTGLTPGFAGLIQSNFVVAAEAQPGGQELIFTFTPDAKLGLDPVSTPPVTLFVAE